MKLRAWQAMGIKVSIQESEVTAAVSLEEILFPSAEPWLLSAESKASARRSCLACANAARMASPESAGAWLQAEMLKIQQGIPGPMAGFIAARALQYGRQSSIWLQKGGSIEGFLQGQGEHLESAKAMQASVLSWERSDLFEPGADWLAQSAAWSSSMALGPMNGEKSSKAIFWVEDFGGSVWRGSKDNISALRRATMALFGLQATFTPSAFILGDSHDFRRQNHHD